MKIEFGDWTPDAGPQSAGVIEALNVLPGEEGYIGVVFDSHGRLGHQKPTVTVVTNAKPSTYELHLEGIVDAGEEDSSEAKDSL